MEMKNNSRKLFALELTTILLFALVAIGHLSVIKYAQGYYGSYGISLPEINFVPEMYDYVNVLPLTLIASAVVVLIAYVFLRIAMWAGDLLGEKSKPSKWFVDFLEKHELIAKLLLRSLQWVMRILILVSFLWALSVVISISENMGKVNAEAKKNYSSISSQGDIIQKVIIYKNDGDIVLKPYDTELHKFLDDYEVVSGASYKTRSVHF
jgi:hypothetical protein